MIKITQMSNVNWTQSPKVKATCTVEVMGFGIKECKVIDGENGIFVVSPSKELKTPYVNKDGKTIKYEDMVWFPVEHRDTINELVTNHYDSNKPSYKPYDDKGNLITFGKKVSNEEEIPF
tara:strand:- start:2826 stop:3185 length:360 start_codon:yes stop_codon:yes gene_type:complete